MIGPGPERRSTECVASPARAIPDRAGAGAVPLHPAKFSDDILDVIGQHAQGRVLDPFAGTGRIHRLAHRDGVSETVGVELEPEWAAAHPATLVGDALALPFRPNSFDTIATSPTFGNRLADHHDAQDGSVRHSYTHDLGRKLHPNNAGLLHFGDDYRRFHVAAWREAKRVLRPGGLMVVHVSDFIRSGQTMPVVTFHRLTLGRLGLSLIHEVYLPKEGLRYGANRTRVDHEVILVASYGPPPRPPRRHKTRAVAAHRVTPQLVGQLSIFDVLGEP